LIATRRLPSLAPGFFHQETESAEVARQVEELFKKPSALGHFVPEENNPLEEELTRLYPPDIAFYPRTQDIGFVHRHTDSAEIYFIANTSNQRVQTMATFRVKGKNPEWWDLFAGEATSAQVLRGGGDGTRIPVDLEPYGSRLLVFSDRKAEVPKETVPFELPRRDDLDISRDWDVTFEGTGKKMHMDFLRPWTEIEGLQFFSGRASYQRKIYVPSDFLRRGNRVNLNLGEPTAIPIQKDAHFQAWLDGPVREAAEVYVNGRRAGTIWHPPYELDVTPFIHAGENELRIVVGNTAVNEMAGSPLPDRAQLRARYGERFVDQGNELIQPVPSGLTGRVRLIERRQASAVGMGH
jgi:hypothetical protein